jgi:hypothetical protein
MTRAQQSSRPNRNRGILADEIEWNEYPRIIPGEYRAYCKWGKHYRDPGFSRWTCLLRWDALSADLLSVLACVPQWFALGERDKPYASRRGKYLPEWIRANGGPPVRKDRLSPNVFVRRFARVEIRDTDGPAPYSVVSRIIEWETGLPGHSISKSHSQARLSPTSAGSGACGQQLAVIKASALAGVEGAITPANTHRAGLPVSGSPVKGSSPFEQGRKQRIEYPPPQFIPNVINHLERGVTKP